MWGWWFLNVGFPYWSFLNEWLWTITISLLVVSSVGFGKTLHKNSFDTAGDYWSIFFLIMVITIAGPGLSALFVFLFPAVAMIGGCMGLAAVMFFGAQNNFWIKRGK